MRVSLLIVLLMLVWIATTRPVCSNPIVLEVTPFDHTVVAGRIYPLEVKLHNLSGDTKTVTMMGCGYEAHFGIDSAVLSIYYSTGCSINIPEGFSIQPAGDLKVQLQVKVAEHASIGKHQFVVTFLEYSPEYDKGANRVHLVSRPGSITVRSRKAPLSLLAAELHNPNPIVSGYAIEDLKLHREAAIDILKDFVEISSRERGRHALQAIDEIGGVKAEQELQDVTKRELPELLADLNGTSPQRRTAALNRLGDLCANLGQLIIPKYDPAPLY